MQPLEKMALIHNDPSRPMMVWRVENENGEGPYKSTAADKLPFELAAAIRNLPRGRAPGPNTDFGGSDILDSGMMDQFDPNPSIPAPIFGFESPEHAKAWFGSHLDQLAEHGFKLRQRPAKKVWRSKSGKQLMFEPNKVKKSMQSHPWDDKISKLKKSFADFRDNMSQEALSQFGRLAPDQQDWFAKQLFHDSLVPGVGNKRAYQDFRSRPREGVHVVLDLNDFKALNDLFSYQHGDDAITNAGNVFSQASRANRGKLFRVGGDEFRAHFDTPEQAYSFLRHASQGMGNMVPVGGHHRVSFSAGIGQSPDHADQALHYAKGAKTARYGSFRTGNASLGHGQNFAHSLLPGAAGAVLVADEPVIPEGVGIKQTQPMPMPHVG